MTHTKVYAIFVPNGIGFISTLDKYMDGVINYFLYLAILSSQHSIFIDVVRYFEKSY